MFGFYLSIYICINHYSLRNRMHCNIQLSLLLFTLQCKWILQVTVPVHCALNRHSSGVQYSPVGPYSIAYSCLYVLMFYSSFSCAFFHYCIALYDFDLILWFPDNCLPSSHLPHFDCLYCDLLRSICFQDSCTQFVRLRSITEKSST